MSEFREDDNPRKYTVSSKIDLDTQTTLIDCAGLWFDGSISNAIYTMICDWLRNEYRKGEKGKFNSASPTIQRRMYNKVRKERERLANEQYNAWIEMQATSDEKMVELMKKEAEEKDLPWPPTDKFVPKIESVTREHEVEIKEELNRLWDDNNDVISFRDLGRSLRGYPPEVLWEYVCRFDQDGFLVLKEIDRRSIKICRPDNVKVLSITNRVKR